MLSVLIRIIFGVIGGLLGFVIAEYFNGLSLKEKIKCLKNWLLYAVSEAESIYGEKLGAIKLEYVYERFQEVFPHLASKISFEKFSSFVDEALEKMRNCIESNSKFKEYIGIKEEEK